MGGEGVYHDLADWLVISVTQKRFDGLKTCMLKLKPLVLTCLRADTHRLKTCMLKLKRGESGEWIHPAAFYDLRQMINLLLPDFVCDNITLVKISVNGEIPRLRNSRESLGPIISIRT